MSNDVLKDKRAIFIKEIKNFIEILNKVDIEKLPNWKLSALHLEIDDIMNVILGHGDPNLKKLWKYTNIVLTKEEYDALLEEELLKEIND